MSNRKGRAKIAQETLKILERGVYTAPAGNNVRIDALLEQAQNGSRCHAGDRLLSERHVLLLLNDLSQLPHRQFITSIRPSRAARNAFNRRIGNRHVEFLLKFHYEFDDVQLVRPEIAQRR